MVRVFLDIVPGWDGVAAIEGPADDAPEESCCIVFRYYRKGDPGSLGLMRISYHHPKTFDFAVRALWKDSFMTSALEFAREIAKVFEGEEG
jgi:hypothetical protein